MAISTLCSGCQSLFRLPDELAGKQVRCQKCQRVMMVPGLLSAPAKAPLSKAPPLPRAPRPDPAQAAPTVTLPPTPPPMPPSRPEPMPAMSGPPPGDGLPAVVLVEVPVKAVPPPMPEGNDTARPPQGPPPRRPAPTMTLANRSNGRRATNRPRRPASVLAGIALGGMLLLFVALLGISGATWLVTEIQSNPRHQPQFNNNVVVGGPNVIVPPGQPVQPQPFQPIQPGFGQAPQPLNGAQGTPQVFSPGPPGPKFDDKRATRINLQNGQFVTNSRLSNNDPRDPVQRWQVGVAQPLPCKVFLVELQKGKRYVFDYKSPVGNINQFNQFNQIQFQFDPYLRIESLDGERLVEGDDVIGQQDLNSHVELHPIKTGTYRIFCTVFQHPPLGDQQFTLSIREQAMPMPAVNQNLPKVQPRVGNDRFGMIGVTDKDLRATFLQKPPLRPVGDLCWSADGKSFYVLYNTGLLLKIAVDGFVEQRRLEMGRVPGSLALSGQGLLVTVPPLNAAFNMAGTNEVWLMDPESLEVKHRFGVHMRGPPAPPAIVASAPGLNFAYVASTVPLPSQAGYPTTHGVAVLDLVNKGPARFYDLPNLALTVSPNGETLFAMNHDVLTSFQIDKATGDVAAKGTSHPYPRNGNALLRVDVSPDNKYVSVSGPSAPLPLLKENPKARQTTVFVYPVDNLRKPAFGIDTDMAVRAVGFDPARASGVFSQARNLTLAVFDGDGQRKTGYPLRDAGAVAGATQSPLQFLTHPDGNKLLIRFPDRLCFAVLKGEQGPLVVKKNEPNPNWPVPAAVNDAEPLLGKAFNRGDIAYRELQFPNLGTIDPCWDADGKALFHLEADGTLSRVSVPDFLPKQRLWLGQPAAAMALSAQGLLVAFRDVPEVWVINPRTLKVERAITLPSPAKALASHPKLSIAATVGAEVALLDLKEGRVTTKRLQAHPDAGLQFHSPALTPDGKYLLLAHASAGDSKVLRVRVAPDLLVIEESRPTTTKGLHSFCVTADSKHVAWYTHNVNSKEPTAFYAIADWQAPAIALTVRARVMAPDTAGGVYLQTTGLDVQHLRAPTAKTATPVPWEAGGIRIRHLAPQPLRPTAFLASTGGRVVYGERAVK